eukprot:403351477
MWDLQRNQRDSVNPEDVKLKGANLKKERQENVDKNLKQNTIELKLKDIRRSRDDQSLLRNKVEERRKNFIEADIKLEDLQNDNRQVQKKSTIVKQKKGPTKDLNQDLDEVMNFMTKSQSVSEPGPICLKFQKRSQKFEDKLNQSQLATDKMKSPKSNNQSPKRIHSTLALQKKDFSQEINLVKNGKELQNIKINEEGFNSDPIEESLSLRMKIGGEITSVLEDQILKQLTNPTKQIKQTSFPKQQTIILDEMDEEELNNKRLSSISSLSQANRRKMSSAARTSENTKNVEIDKKQRKLKVDTQMLPPKQKSKIKEQSNQNNKLEGNKEKEDLIDDPIAQSLQNRLLHGSIEHVLTETEVKKINKIKKNQVQQQQNTEISKNGSKIQTHIDIMKQENSRNTLNFKQKSINHDDNRKSQTNTKLTIPNPTGIFEQFKLDDSPRSQKDNEYESVHLPLQQQKRVILNYNEKPKIQNPTKARKNKAQKSKVILNEKGVHDSFEETVIVSSNNLVEKSISMKDQIIESNQNFSNSLKLKEELKLNIKSKSEKKQHRKTISKRSVNQLIQEIDEEEILIVTKTASRNNRLDTQYNTQKTPNKIDIELDQANSPPVHDLVSIEIPLNQQNSTYTPITKQPFIIRNATQKARQLIQLDDSLEESPSKIPFDQHQELIHKFNTQKILDIENSSIKNRIVELRKESSGNFSDFNDSADLHIQVTTIKQKIVEPLYMKEDETENIMLTTMSGANRKDSLSSVNYEYQADYSVINNSQLNNSGIQ